jgi:glycosyltransferase involved in cell wall biosynthesis
MAERGKRKISSIVWVTNTLHTAGGGSRLLLEGSNYYRSKGIDVKILTWDFGEEALFNGTYPNDNIVILADDNPPQSASILRRVLHRLRTTRRLRQEIRKANPDLILNQSEYDCILLFYTLLGTPYRYGTFIFGQMYQFHEDLAKYTLMFRRHLKEIRNSTAGYREILPETCPPTSLSNRLSAEVLAVLRYFAVRKSQEVFVFSKQVKWEVGKVYGMQAKIAKGAFPYAILNRTFDNRAAAYRNSPDEKILLSMCRLIKKKRVDLKLRAFQHFLNGQKDRNYRMLIGGRGEDYEKLVALAGELGIADCVTFLGYVPEQDVYPLTAHCDVYLSLDVADFDISPYEALALQRPVIWSSEMDADEYLSKCPAVFAVEPTVENVSAAIGQALALDTKSVDWSGMAKYSWEAYFQEMLDVYERVESKP